MSNSHAVDISKHIRTYIVVFVSLMVLTVVTVAVSYLHLPIKAAIGVALAIATVKGSLVACYFMHLISERKLIYAVMLLTVAFFVVLLFVPLFTAMDPIEIREMNLKAVHVVFIAASVGLAVMLGTWCLRRWLNHDGGLTLLAAIGSFVAAAGLVAYGGWFLAKTRQLR